MSSDTYPYNFSNPVELNRYVYAANNPATMVDPSGHGFVTQSEQEELSLQQTEELNYYHLDMEKDAAKLKQHLATAEQMAEEVEAQTDPYIRQTMLKRLWQWLLALLATKSATLLGRMGGLLIIMAVVSQLAQPVMQLLPDQQAQPSTPEARSSPQPTATPDDNDRGTRKHIALGLRAGLESFIIKLNNQLRFLNISVHGYQKFGEYGSWSDVGLSDMDSTKLSNWDGENGNGVFAQATARAETIHFNLEGMLEMMPRRGYYDSYAAFTSVSPKKFGDYAEFTTATELLFIERNPALCSKTLFYVRGTSDAFLVPSIEASLEICGSAPFGQ